MASIRAARVSLEHERKEFYPGLLEYTTSGPIVVMCVEAVAAERELVRWFGPEELADYTRDADRWNFEQSLRVIALAAF